MTTPAPHGDPSVKTVDIPMQVVTNDQLAPSVYGDQGWDAALQMPALPDEATSNDTADSASAAPQSIPSLAQQVEIASEAPSASTDAQTQPPIQPAAESLPEKPLETPAQPQLVAPAATTTPLVDNPTAVIQPKQPRAISDSYEITTASVPGRAHMGYGELVVGVNNQDSLFAALREDYGIVVVCDGCSKTKHSEVGAKILTRLFTEAFQKHQHIGIVHQILAKVEAEVAEELKLIVDKLVLDNETRDDVVRDYFLCTVLGAYISTAGVTFWGMGDGIYGFDSHMRYIEPAAGNYPAYFGYKLYKEWPSNIAQHGLEIYDQIMHHPSSILVGTDGVKDLIELGNKNFPGTHDPIGKIERLWKENRYWENPDELARELRRLQSIRKTSDLKTTEEEKLGVTRVITELTEQVEGGFLPDDTTLAILREIPEAPQKVEPKYSSGIFARAPMSQVGRRSVGVEQRADSQVDQPPKTIETPAMKAAPELAVAANRESGGIFQRLGQAINGVFSWLRGLFSNPVAAPVVVQPNVAAPDESKPQPIVTNDPSSRQEPAPSGLVVQDGAKSSPEGSKEAPPESS